MIEWTLQEVVERYEREREPDEIGREWIFDRWHFRGTGRLKIQMSPYVAYGMRKSWGDGSVQKIEDQLVDAVAGFVFCAEEMHREQLEREERHRKWREEAAAREMAERLRKEEELRREKLRNASVNWDSSVRLSRFIDECERMLLERSVSIAPGSVEHRWITWAREVASASDPLRTGFLEKSIETFPDDPGQFLLEIA